MEPLHNPVSLALLTRGEIGQFVYLFSLAVLNLTPIIAFAGGRRIIYSIIPWDIWLCAVLLCSVLHPVASTNEM